ncbi:tetratricopeptide repeat protein [Methylacidimicrobium tartarophylax]|uniref:TPR repeat-containing protein YrrB n=1 Tax=Methylacidimicrobium tartarophylax TaxID=1041768 RepID=A0A5E6MEW9_9BACT|nr:tetratricopeptide repeat protein [Methylacidimicrobium tartarophylax]VVM06373.1 TPR repeat-containing protein YrrB [Methylacidimicrobium tartarophylax]
MVALCDGSKGWKLGRLGLYSFLFSLILPASSFGQILDPIALAKKVQPSVLLVLEKESSGKVVATGSGFLVSADGKLVTNDHGSKKAEDLSAQAADGRVLRVQSILERDPAHDRELLQLAAEGLPFLLVAASVSVHPGELLAIIPSRFAGRNAVSLGTAFAEQSLFGPSRLLVATEAVARLYPGAPVVGSEGQVLGVATTRSRAKPGQLLIPVATIGKLTVLPAAGSPKQGAVAPLQTATERAGATPIVDVGKALKTPGAGQAVQELIPLSPRETGGEKGVAWALLQHGNYEKAAAAFEQALRRRSSDARAWLGFGLAKQHLGQTEEASAAFRQAVALSPSSGQAWCELGRVDLERKRYREAAGSFERAVRLQPQDARAWLGVAAANLALERRQEVLAALGRVQVSDPADTAIWRGIGEVYSRLGRPEDAATAFQRAVDRNPGDARAWLDLGLTSVELGRMERAQEILPKLFVLDPDLGTELVQALKTR